MDRTEHLQWCKDRALEYIERDDLNGAFASFSSDMSKHLETAKHSALELGIMLFFGGHLSTANEMKKWINDFN